MSVYDRPTPEESDEARKQYDAALADMEQNHPAELIAIRLVDALFQQAIKQPMGALPTRRDRERDNAGHGLFAEFQHLRDMPLIQTAPIDVKERVFLSLAKQLMAAFACGDHSIPDVPRTARDIKAEQDAARAEHTLVAVETYLRVNGLSPKIPRKTVEDHTRFEILDAMGLPLRSKHPTVTAIMKALKAIRKK